MTMIDGLASVGFLDEQMLAGQSGTHAIGRKDPLDGFVDSIDGGPSPLSFLALINKDSWLPVTPTVTLWMIVHSFVSVSHDNEDVVASNDSPFEYVNV